MQDKDMHTPPVNPPAPLPVDDPLIALKEMEALTDGQLEGHSGGAFSRLKGHKMVIVAIAATLGIGLVILAGVVTYFPSLNMQKGSAGTPAGSTRRSIEGTNLHYNVKTDYENRFNIVALYKKTDGAPYIFLSGKGCNSMSANVYLSQPTGSRLGKIIDEHRVGDITYFMGDFLTTSMACTGEAAEYDAIVQHELENVFQSIQ